MVLLDSLHLIEVCPMTLTTHAIRIRVRITTRITALRLSSHSLIDNTMSGTDAPTVRDLTWCQAFAGACGLPRRQLRPPARPPSVWVEGVLFKLEVGPLAKDACAVVRGFGDYGYLLECGGTSDSTTPRSEDVGPLDVTGGN